MTMNKEKQIEEMILTVKNAVADNAAIDREEDSIMLDGNDLDHAAEQTAEALYETGYRKRSEGEWIPTYTYTAEGTGIYKCSLCGRKSANPKADNFCPNCGAEMKGGE